MPQLSFQFSLVPFMTFGDTSSPSECLQIWITWCSLEDALKLLAFNHVSWTTAHGDSFDDDIGYILSTNSPHLGGDTPWPVSLLASLLTSLNVLIIPQTCASVDILTAISKLFYTKIYIQHNSVASLHLSQVSVICTGESLPQMIWGNQNPTWFD